MNNWNVFLIKNPFFVYYVNMENGKKFNSFRVLYWRKTNKGLHETSMIM